MSTWILPASRRAVVFLMGTAAVAAGIWTALAMRARIPGLELTGPGYALKLSPGVDWPWLLAAAISLLLGALLLWLALGVSHPSRPQPWVLLTAPVREGRGATTISLSTRSLHALVAYVGERVEGVRQVLPTVQRTEEGWAIRCEVQLWSSASVSDVSRALRETLSQQIEHHTGVPVAALRLDFTYDLATERELLR